MRNHQIVHSRLTKKRRRRRGERGGGGGGRKNGVRDRKKKCIEDFISTSQRIEKLKIENVVLRRYLNDKCLRSGTDRAVQLKNEERHHHNRK